MKKWVSFVLVLGILIQCTEEPKPDPLEDLLALFLIVELLKPPGCPSRRNQSNGKPDPLYPFQWHLKNTGNFGGIAGRDSNVEPVWNLGHQGAGIHITVVDDGVNLCHEDLQNNVDFKKGFNIDFTKQLPLQVNGNAPCDEGNACHGTAVAGVAAAIGTNGIGGSGTAPAARLSGRNLLLSTEENFSPNTVTAMTENIKNIHISNNSWGAPDTTGFYNNSLGTSSWKSAVQEGITSGRGGKGTLYFWAGGNGGRIFAIPQTVISSFNDGLIWIDNSNYDSQANDPSVMAICAIGNTGEQVYYSERGANLLVCGYSEGNNGIRTTTTDIMGQAGYNFDSNASNYSSAFNNNYTNQFNGTSSATPNVAGVAALVLHANPNLNWREVRWILAKSATKVDPNDPEWVNNGAGLPVNHRYGFGAVNANSAVNLAKTSPPSFGPVVERTCAGSSLSIPTDTNLSPVFAQTTCSIQAGIGKIESVEVTVSFNSSTHIGDIDLRVVSPAGTESRLNEPHPCLSEEGSADLNQVACNTEGITWTYMTLRNMDEPATGTWTLKVVDRLTAPVMSPNTYIFPGGGTLTVGNTASHNNSGAAITSWSIKIRGRAL